VKTRNQVITLGVGAAWVSGAALLSDDVFQFVAFAFPGAAAASLAYSTFSRHFRSAILAIITAMTAWVSIALFVGKSNCCATEEQYRYQPHHPANLAGDYIRLNRLDGGYLELKTPTNVTLEVLQLAIPGVLVGLIGIWWVRRKGSENSGRLEWEIDHSPESQPFPELSVTNFGTRTKPLPQYSFYCYGGMEVIDELPTGVHTVAVACPSCGYEYDLSHEGRRWAIIACR
jgi:hypothetical protein